MASVLPRRTSGVRLAASHDDDDVAAVTARLEALAAGEDGGNGGTDKPRATSRGRMRWDDGDAGASAAPRTGRSRTRSRSRSRSASRARMLAAGGGDAEEDEPAPPPKRTSLFSDLEPRGRRATPDAVGWATGAAARNGGSPGEGGGAGAFAAPGAPTLEGLADARRKAHALLARSAGPASLSPGSDLSGDGGRAGDGSRGGGRRAMFDRAPASAPGAPAARPPSDAAGAAARRNSQPPGPPSRRKPPSPHVPPSARDLLAAAHSPTPASEPADRAAALGAALADIVRARSDRERFGAPLSAAAAAAAAAAAGGNEPGGGGWHALARARRLADPDAPAAGGPAHSGYGVAGDSNALNSALTEQGKFRPSAAVAAAREAEWEASAGGSFAMHAARRAALGAPPLSAGGAGAALGRDGGKSPGRQRGGGGGGGGNTSALPVAGLRRTASCDAVESAGVSVVRALSGMPRGVTGGGGGGGGGGMVMVMSGMSAEAAAAAAAAMPSSAVTPQPSATHSAAPSPFPNMDDDMLQQQQYASESAHADAGAGGAAAAVAAYPSVPLPPTFGGIGVAAGGPLRVLAGYADGSLRAWRASDGAMLFSVREAHEGPLRAVAVLAGGAIAVTAGGGGDDARGALRVWTLAPTAAQHAATLLPGGPGAAGGGDASTAVGAVHALAPLDVRRLAAGCADGGVALWNIPGRSCDLVLRGHEGAVHALAPLPSAELATGGDDGVVRIFGTWDGVCEKELRGHTSPVRALAALDAGTVLASGSLDGCLRLWSVETGECMAALRDAHAPAGVRALCELAGGRLASSGDDASLALWQPRAAGRDASLRWPSAARDAHGATQAVALLRLGSSHAAAGCTDGSLRLWRAADGEAVAMLLPDDVGGDGADETYAADGASAVTSLALAGGTPPTSDVPARARCGPARVRDRLWCFAGGSRLC
jgi:hypothetical protein